MTNQVLRPSSDLSSNDENDGAVESSQALLLPSDGSRDAWFDDTPPAEVVISPQSSHHIVHRHLSMTDSTDTEISSASAISNTRKYLSVFVLFLINLLNYMDRFTIAGVLLQIKEHFQISNGNAGLLQTVFVIAYMIVAPVFGYLGDRFNRKLVMLFGMVIWSGCTFAASFIDNPDHFMIFLGARALVGIGEASYSTIAPTIIADLFEKSQRTRMLSVFFFAIPVGGGLGYVVGQAAADAFGSWHWALRVTPALGVITMLLMMIVLPNVKRGASESISDLVKVEENVVQKTSYIQDLKEIVKIKSFIFLTLGFTMQAFVVGSLTLWGPIYVQNAMVIMGELQPCSSGNCENGDIAFIFGIIVILSGISGVWIGGEWAKRWRDRGQQNADALVCAIGLLMAGPLLMCGFLLPLTSLPAAWVCLYLAETSLNLIWTLVGELTLAINMPSRRATANAIQILFLHLFGDAGSPYLLGLVSDVLAGQMPDTHYSEYLALQRAMFITLFAAALASAGFFIASLFVVKDKKKVEDALKGKNEMTTSATSSEATHNSYELNVNSTVYTPITDQDDMFQINNKPITPPSHDDVTHDVTTTTRPPPYLSVLGKSPNGKQQQGDDEAKKSLLTPEATSEVMTSSVDSSRSSTRSNSFLLPDAKESVI